MVYHFQWLVGPAAVKNHEATDQACDLGINETNMMHSWSYLHLYVYKLSGLHRYSLQR